MSKPKFKSKPKSKPKPKFPLTSPPPAAPTPPSWPGGSPTVGDIVLVVEGLAMGFLAGIDAVVKGPLTMPQFVLVEAMAFQRIGKIVGDTDKTFKDQMRLHRDKGGQFEHGSVAIDFPDNGTRAPQWKEEAAKLAETIVASGMLGLDGAGDWPALVELRSCLKPDGTLDRDVYFARVLDRYPRSTRIGVDLVRSA